MALSVKLQVFEGPLDLLLHLIDINKIDIYDIPISLITDQYLAYIRQMQALDMEIMSEFLVMAATLLRIKSKMLLPKEPKEEAEREDPRAELVERLLEHKMYRYMAMELKDRQLDASKSLYKGRTLPADMVYEEPPVDLEALVGDMDFQKLHRIFLDVLKRQENKEAKPFWQEFEIEAEGELSIAAMLNELNARQKLTDKSGKEAEPISWECGCMVKKCGACAMRINGLPELACSTFLQSLKGKVIVLEPLSKFPVVKDLIVDRSVVFENLKKINLWLESDAYMTEYTHEIRYQSARCLMCGCCLEVCPNFDFGKDFAGAIAPVNAYRILNEEQDTSHHEQIAEKYRKHYFEGCGKSLSCQNICPAGIPVEELMVRSNAAAVWKK